MEPPDDRSYVDLVVTYQSTYTCELSVKKLTNQIVMLKENINQSFDTKIKEEPRKELTITLADSIYGKNHHSVLLNNVYIIE